MTRTILLAIAVMLAFAGACNGEDDGDEISQEVSEVQDTIGTLTADEIAGTLTGFVEAFANGDTDALASYWSEACGADEVARAATAATLFRGAVGQATGEARYSLTVDAARLVFQVLLNNVMVPLDQPEGVLQATIDGDPIGEQVNPLLSKEELHLVREGSEWKVANCTIFAGDEDEEEEA